MKDQRPSHMLIQTWEQRLFGIRFQFDQILKSCVFVTTPIHFSPAEIICGYLWVILCMSDHVWFICSMRIIYFGALKLFERPVTKKSNHNAQLFLRPSVWWWNTIKPYFIHERHFMISIHENNYVPLKKMFQQNFKKNRRGCWTFLWKQYGS